MNVAYNAAFANPFPFGSRGVQYSIQGVQHDIQGGQYGQYGQDGQLHNFKILGVRKRKCRECDNYGCKGANNRNKCENKKA